jgi:hypothetical protein
MQQQQQQQSRLQHQRTREDFHTLFDFCPKLAQGKSTYKNTPSWLQPRQQAFSRNRNSSVFASRRCAMASRQVRARAKQWDVSLLLALA